MAATALPPRPRLGSVSLTRNVVANWSATGFNILATFFVTPIVVSALHQELYGAWSFLNGLLVYADLLYLGLGASLIRSVATFKAEQRDAQLNRVFGSVFSIYLLLGLLCLSALTILSPHVPGFFAVPLATPGADAAVRHACVLLGVQLFAAFAGSAFSGVLVGLDRIDLAGFVRIAVLVVRTAAIVVVVRGSAPLVSLAAVVAACGIIETASLAVLARALHPGLAIRLVRPTRAELRALYGFGLQAFVVTLALTLIAYTDTTVVGVAVGAASVALYALPLQLVEYIRIVAGGASGVWVPRLTVMASRGDLPGLRAAYVTVTRVTMFLATFLVVNIVFLGPPFLGLWVGPAFSDVHGIVLCLSLAMLLHIYAVTAPMSFYYAMNILRVPAAVLLLEALANLGLSLFLARRFGVIGVALGTLIPAAVVGSVVLPPFLRKRLGLPARDGLRALAPSIGLLVAGGLVHLGLRETVGSHSFALLALKGLLSVPAMALVFFLMFPRDDRDWLVRQVQRIVGLRSSIGATVPAIGALLRRGRVAR